MSRAQDALDRAADWIVRQEDVDWNDEDQAEFEAWLHASDGHRAAYWRLKHSWKRADRIKALGPVPAARIERRLVHRWKIIAVAASIVVVIGSFPFFGPKLSSYAVRKQETAMQDVRIETPVGGRKQIALSDGSKIELNTASALRVVMSAKVRKVSLERGEAYFDVAHVQNRPFLIESGDHVITVLGTKFVVRQDVAKTTVSVVSGRVQLTGAAGANRLAILTRGDVAIASGDSTLVTTHTPQELEDILSWRGGMLTFDGTPLNVVAAEFNRYNRRQIVISDPKDATMRIGGSFPATNPDAFIRLMKDGYGLKVEVDGGIAKISR